MDIRKKDIKAMINLLDDPNKEVFKTVFNTLLEQGNEVIPELERTLEDTYDRNFRERIEYLIQQIQFKITEKDLITWIKSGSDDILEGSFLIAKFQFPDLKFSDINTSIETIKRDVWLELNDNLTALEKIRLLNQIFFETYHFSIEIRSVSDQQHLYINQIIETKKGNPVSIAILYIIIAQKLNMPVYGINFPENYLLAYKDEPVYGDVLNDNSCNILFYINPYNKGAVLGRKEIEYFLCQHQVEPNDSYYLPCDNMTMIRRLIHTIITTNERLGNRDKVNQFECILRLFPQL